jgi:hypothetical protein
LYAGETVCPTKENGSGIGFKDDSTTGYKADSKDSEVCKTKGDTDTMNVAEELSIICG